eukprot:COSAG01_NODE_470_length_16575_cov_5.572408_7_plen_65_part_00
MGGTRRRISVTATVLITMHNLGVAPRTASAAIRSRASRARVGSPSSVCTHALRSRRTQLAAPLN